MGQFAYVIDDEEAMRASLRALLATRDNLLMMTFASADAFLTGIVHRKPGVVLLDLNMPGRSGLDVLATLSPMRDRFPTIMVTGQGDVPVAVKAMRLGAIDFLEKPYDHHALFEAVDRGFAELDRAAGAASRAQAARERIALLSPRERQILALLVGGLSNRMMAEHLGLSIRTVEVHRAKVMAKLDVPSLPAAVNLAHAAGLVVPALGGEPGFEPTP